MAGRLLKETSWFHFSTNLLNEATCRWSEHSCQWVSNLQLAKTGSKTCTLQMSKKLQTVLLLRIISRDNGRTDRKQCLRALRALAQVDSKTDESVFSPRTCPSAALKTCTLQVKKTCLKYPQKLIISRSFHLFSFLRHEPTSLFYFLFFFTKIPCCDLSTGE